MFEVKETSPATDLRWGHTVVGITPVQVSAASFKMNRGLLLRAPGNNDFFSANVDAIYIGGPSVTADTSATGGMPLLPGSAMELPLEDPSQVYAVSGTDSQDLAWMGL